MANTLIGFCGPIGSGKTEAAAILGRLWGFKRIRFADPLKTMLRSLGLSEAEVEGEMRAQPSALLGGKTPRFAMQTLGTEWGRQLIDPDLWINAWRRKVEDMRWQISRRVVADDVRFPNEIDAIHDLGGLVIRIDRPGIATDPHPSEHQFLIADHVLSNDGDVDLLAGRLGEMVAELSA